MKNFYGVQLGNYLVDKTNMSVIKVNALTKKKVGYLMEGSNVSYYRRLPEVCEIPLTNDLLGKYSEFLEDYKEVNGNFYIIPENSSNVYEINYFHQLQNIPEFYSLKIEWKS